MYAIGNYLRLQLGHNTVDAGIRTPFGVPTYVLIHRSQPKKV